jgi:hypothetical protein
MFIPCLNIPARKLKCLSILKIKSKDCLSVTRTEPVVLDIEHSVLPFYTKETARNNLVKHINKSTIKNNYVFVRENRVFILPPGFISEMRILNCRNNENNRVVIP